MANKNTQIQPPQAAASPKAASAAAALLPDSRQRPPLEASQLLHVEAMHRILKASYLITQPFFTNFADRYSVTMNELRIVMTLAAMSSAAAHELAHATGMHPMNVSRAVASLTSAGRLKRSRDSALDRRRKILSLTTKGWQLYDNLLPHVKKIAEFMFASMTDLEVEFLSKLVRRLIKRLEDVDPSSPLVIDTEALKAAKNLDEPRRRSTARSRRASAPSTEDH